MGFGKSEGCPGGGGKAVLLFCALLWILRIMGSWIIGEMWPSEDLVWQDHVSITLS